MTDNRKNTDLMMVVASDISGQLRGKAMPLRAKVLRTETGVGWTGTCVQITSFGPIAASPWGPRGDLLIRPDYSTMIDLAIPEYGVNECYVIGDVMTLEDEPWECCLRGQAKAAAERLEKDHGLILKAAFEHEFHYSGGRPQPGLGYALRAFRRMGEFPDRLMLALDRVGLKLDTFMPEYGPGQCEVTIGPNEAIGACDDAVVLREMTRAVAHGLGERASFAPILDPDGVGNGVHLHFSLHDVDGNPVDLDNTKPHGVSEKAGAFVAGVVRRLPEFVSMTAPAVASYIRMTPHRWSPTCNNFGYRDREAAVRICPVFKPQDEKDVAGKFHFEYRVSDAAASPYLVMAALLNAGLNGLDEGMPTPEITESDPNEMTPEQLANIGCARLPNSLADALDRLEASDWAKAAFGETFIEVYLAHKRCEIDIMSGLTDTEICEKYAQAY
ncbi:MAG: glutamine synthetase [Rhizobiaceae bacterium MnEN-MB40S]|nr:MAG: glutamine synthetase [Rhizobiaceae bacterium MnEN-MB40S]